MLPEHGKLVPTIGLLHLPLSRLIFPYVFARFSHLLSSGPFKVYLSRKSSGATVPGSKLQQDQSSFATLWISLSGYWFLCFNFVAVQLLSHIQLFATPWTAVHQDFLSFTISWSLLKFMSVELVMLSNHFILCFPLFLLPSVFPHMRVSSNEQSGLISFRIDWFDLLAVWGTQESSPAPQFSKMIEHKPGCY